MKKGLPVLFLFISTLISGQNKLVDSLKNELKKANKDTVRVNILNDLAEKFLTIADYKNSINSAYDALQLSERIAFKRGKARSYYYIASGNRYLGDYPQGMNSIAVSLKLYEELQDLNGIGYCYNRIGSIFSDQGKVIEAKENYLKSIACFKKTNNIDWISKLYNNIANTFSDPKIALHYYDSSFTQQNKFNDASYYSNTAKFFFNRKDYDKYLENQFVALKLWQEVGDIGRVASTYCEIGNVYRLKNNLKQAEFYLNKSLDMVIPTGNKMWIQRVFSILYEFTIEKKDYKKALENYGLSNAYKDSLSNDQFMIKFMQAQMQFNFAKKQIADSTKTAEEKKVMNAELKSEQYKRYGLYGGLLAVLVFSGFIFRQFKKSQKQRKLIEAKEKETAEQKRLVEDKNKEILDSIYYARRIQRSLLPSENYIAKQLKQVKK